MKTNISLGTAAILALLLPHEREVPLNGSRSTEDLLFRRRRVKHALAQVFPSEAGVVWKTVLRVGRKPPSAP